MIHIFQMAFNDRFANRLARCAIDDNCPPDYDFEFMDPGPLKDRVLELFKEHCALRSANFACLVQNHLQKTPVSGL